MGLFGDSMEGFPFWQLSIVCLMRFSEPIAFTSLFPYVYFMVRDFHVTDDPTQISRYTGYMGASFAFAQFLCCIHWGRLSDRIGRKPVLIMGLLGTMTSLLIFGFSRNFYIAIAARTLMGALNGNLPVIQTMVGEIATERRHQSLAFSTVPILYNVGCVIGPAIGGSKLFTRPRMSPEGIEGLTGSDAYDRFVSKHPYAMSNVVVACLLLFSATVGFLFLEETEAKARKRYDPGLAMGNWILRHVGLSRLISENSRSSKQIPKIASSSAFSEATEVTPLNPSEVFGSVDDVEDTENALDDDEDGASINSYDAPFTRRTSLAIIRRYSSTSLTRTTTNVSVLEETKSIFKAFADKNIFSNKVRGTILAYFCLSFHSLVFNEFLPVFLAGTYQLDSLHFPWHMKGGMSWATSDIGMLLSTTGMTGCITIIFLFPYLDRHIRKIDVFRIGSVIFPPMYIILPYVVYTKREMWPQLPEWFSTFATYFCVSSSTFAQCFSFPQMVILLYRATKPRHRAFVNATSISATALARCVAPVIWGTLMSYFDKIGMTQMSWHILAIIALITSIIAFRLDEYDEDLVQEPAAVAEGEEAV